MRSAVNLVVLAAVLAMPAPAPARGADSGPSRATRGERTEAEDDRCVQAHFAAADLLLEGDYARLLGLLDAAGPVAATDRFLVEARAEALFRSERYHQAALVLKRALALGYECEFTRAYRAVPFRRADLLLDGLMQHNLAAIHRKLGEAAQAEAAAAESRRLLRESIVDASGYPRSELAAETERLLALYGIDRPRPARW